MAKAQVCYYNTSTYTHELMPYEVSRHAAEHVMYTTFARDSIIFLWDGNLREADTLRRMMLL